MASCSMLPITSGIPSSFAPNPPLEPSLFSLLAILLVVFTVFHLLKPKLRLPPGPLPLPILGNWLQVGNDLNHENLSQLARRFGEIFLLRMGQRNLVVISSPKLAREVLHTRGIEFGSRTRNVVFDIFTGEGKDMVFSGDGELWEKMRRIMTEVFFTSKVVQQSSVQWEEEVNYAIQDLKNKLGSATTGVVARQRLQMLMYNILYRMMFNRRFEREDDPLFVELRWLNGERSRLTQSFEYNYGDFIPILRPFLRKYLQRCQTVKDTRVRLFNRCFIKGRKSLDCAKPPSDEEKCALDHILDAQKNGEITEENVFYMVEIINVAAIEITSWSIEWGLAQLVNNPNIQTRVREEMTTTLGKGVPITTSDLPRLPYLHAVVKETMRLHMAIPLLVPHMNLHQAKLGGYDIPAESAIVVNAWYLANNPEWWEKPEVFNPERFLGAEKIEANGSDFRFLPFGAGRRGCPGIILAIPVASLVLGRLVQAFELMPPPGKSKVDTSGKGGQFSLRIANPSMIVYKPISQIS